MCCLTIGVDVYVVIVGVYDVYVDRVVFIPILNSYNHMILETHLEPKEYWSKEKYCSQ